MISKQKDISNKLADERLEEITKSHKKVNSGDLWKYKRSIPDAKLNEFDNALDLINQIREGKIRLADAKNNLIRFKSKLSEIKKENKKRDQRGKQTLCITLKCFAKQEVILLNFLMIIL